MKPYRIGILLGQKDNSFWSKMKQAYEIHASKFGIDAVYAWPVPGKEDETQLTEFKKMLEASFHAVIVNPLNRYNLVPGILEAASRKIPVLDVGAKTDREAVRSAEPFYVPVKTVDFYQQGVLGATYIIEKLKSVGGGKVAIIEGCKNSTQSIERSRGATDTFSQVSEIRVVIHMPADFNKNKAADASKRIFNQHPDLAAFFCANDLMALGVAEIARVMGLGNRVIIVGVDLIDEAKQAIQAGKMDASVAFSTSSVAEILLDATIKKIKGQAVPEGYTVISRLVDKQTLSI